VFRQPHLRYLLRVLGGIHLLSSLAIMLSLARTRTCGDLQKNLTPEPSHSTLQDSTAMNAAAFVAEYIALLGAAMVAATDDRWCRTGDSDVDAKRGSYS
jgi:hypothetical protein